MQHIPRARITVPQWYYGDIAKSQRERLMEFFSQGPESMLQTRMPPSEAFLTEEQSGEYLRWQEDVAAAFNGRCAFCESTLEGAPIIHRFRPSDNAEPVQDTSVSHLYYISLRDAWENHYPICEGCQPRRPEYFPVKGNRAEIPDLETVERLLVPGSRSLHEHQSEEKHLLLDPCRGYYGEHHLLFLPNGRVEGLSDEGRETIAHFNLDRDQLVEERGRVFREFLTATREMLATPGNEIWLDDIFKRPFTGGLTNLLDETFRLALNLNEPIDTPYDAFDKLKESGDRLQRFDRALAALEKGERAVLSTNGRQPEKSLPPTDEDLPTSISIKAFKSIEQLTIELPVAPNTEQERAPSLLLLGENAAGKSTILEAFTLTMISPRARGMLRPEGKPLHPNKLVLNPEYMGAEDGVDGAQQPQQAEITVTFADGATRSLTILSGDPNVAGFSVEGEAPKILVFAYGAFRHYLSGARQNTEQRYVRSLFETEWLLSNPEQWLLGLDEADFNMVARALREVFAIDGEFDVLKREKWKPTDEDETVFVVSKSNAGPDAAEIRTPLNIVSSGFRTILAMLCDIMQGLIDPKVNPHVTSLENARGLVLIDEIEAHLHPRWKVKIMRGLRRALPNVVFIAASHDPLCLRGMHAGEVMVVERSQERSPLGLPITTQATVDLPDNQNWTIQQLLTADFFKLHSTEARGAELRRAEAEDLLARGETAETSSVVRAYLKEIGDSLPIGDSDVHRVVNEAIAKFLQERRQATLKDMHGLRDDLLENILDALRGA